MWVALLVGHWFLNWSEIWYGSGACCYLIVLTIGTMVFGGNMIFSHKFTNSTYGTFPEFEKMKNDLKEEQKNGTKGNKRMTVREYEIK